MSRSSVWLPDGTKRLWPPMDLTDGSMAEALDPEKARGKQVVSAGAKTTKTGVWEARTTQKWSFKPEVSKKAYVAPPPPQPVKREKPKDPEPTPAAELYELGERLRREADGLAGQAAPPSLLVQLGMKCDNADSIKKVLKDWDNKGKGEMLKGALRNNLRNIGLNASSTEADEMFDSWDDDKGGSLDMEELKTALMKAGDAARDFKSRPDPTQLRALELRKKGDLAVEAAMATEAAARLDGELSSMASELEARADVRLGSLLQKRRINPGAVVTQWAKSRGEHRDELSKRDFREAVLELFQGNAAKKGSSSPRPTSPARATSASEIDAVFDEYDEDGGGYMDMEEAKTMIKGLQAAGVKAEEERRLKEKEAREMRAKANKLAAIALTGASGGNGDDSTIGELIPASALGDGGAMAAKQKHK